MRLTTAKVSLSFRCAGLVVALISVLGLMSGCRFVSSSALPPDRLNGFPRLILWAWERPEDLEFLGSRDIGVAFLAETLTLRGEEVVYQPRRQPLKVSPTTRLIAVTRIESRKTTGQSIALNDTQREKIVSLVLKTLELKNVAAVQIDFDAVVSEREFYRQMLQDLRQKLPNNIPLSMTALASFCVGDRWINDLLVDEAVPMIFQMGADDHAIKDFLTSGHDFRVPLCQRSYGIDFDEQININFDHSRRIYAFNNRHWTENNVDSLLQRINK